MPGDVDILDVLAEVCQTDNPVALIVALEERGVAVTANSEAYDPVAHREGLQAVSEMLQPVWEQGRAIRDQLLREEWTQESAEHISLHIIHVWLSQFEIQVTDGFQEARNA